MATIQNLYILPGDAATGDGVLDALMADGMLRGPVVVGPAPAVVTAGLGGERDVVEPQMALGLPGQPLYDPTATRHARVDDAVADYRGRQGGRLIAAVVNETHVGIARDFDLYQGLEWALGLYAVPEGYHLHRTHEFSEFGDVDDGPAVAVDRTIRTWIHLQGKLAPWRDLFADSSMDRLVRQFWPDRDLFEYPYL